MELIIKEGAQKIHRPQDSPDYNECVKVGKEQWKQMEGSFESEGEKRDYLKAVEANPNNVVGMPPFYPPVRIRSAGGIGPGARARTLPCGHRETTIRHRNQIETVSCKLGHEYRSDNLQEVDAE